MSWWWAEEPRPEVEDETSKEWNEWCPQGDGKCYRCGGKGCSSCNDTGKCSNCGGKGWSDNKNQNCGSCRSNRNGFDSPIFYVPPFERTEEARERKMRERVGGSRHD